MDAYKRTVVNGKKYYGKHLVLDSRGCNENILSQDAIAKFITELVPAIDMVPHGDLVIDHFGDGDEVGISAVQLIVTSAITVHTNDKYRDFYLDLFSCKWYDEDIVAERFKKIFAPQSMNMTVLLRK